MIATDPLSLVFIACFLFGLLFMLATLLLGHIGHGHGFFQHGGDSISQHMHFSGDAHTQHVHAGDAHTSHSVASETGINFSLLTILNPTSLVFFLLGFGFFGYVFHNNTGFALPIVLVLAVICGIIIVVLLLSLLNRLLGNSEGHTIQDVSDRTGLVGKTITTIRENSLGEILYQTPGGLRKSIPARSIDGRCIERGEEVVVLNYKKGIAEVDTWDHLMNSQDMGTEKPAAST